MIYYNNKSYKDFNTLKSENNLVSSSEIMSVCNCNLCRLKHIVSELNIQPLDIKLEPSGRVFTLYSYNDIERIKECAKETYLNDEVPEGYISKKDLSKRLNVKYRTLAAFISRHKEFNKYSKLLFINNSMIRFYLLNEDTMYYYKTILEGHKKKPVVIYEDSIVIDKGSPLNTISFMCNQKQEETIRNFAAASGLSLSQYILSKIFS